MEIISSSRFLEEKLNQIVSRGRLEATSVREKVRRIIESVKEMGDEALLNYTLEFDGVDLRDEGFEVPKRKFAEAYKRLKKEDVEALKFAAENILNFHRAQMPEEIVFSPLEGVELRQRFIPLESVGVYAPGGFARYPSTVLMCAVPARVAGVKNVFLCSPPSNDGEVNPHVLVAADIAGVDKVFRVGGAQAIAALAYGTESIPKVDKIVGPGNVFVNAAKLEVGMDVAIDLPAGPSEIVIVADEYANPDLVVYDLLAQAEHDVNALAILLTSSEELAETVQKRLKIRLPEVNRRRIVEESLRNNGLIVLVKDLNEAVEIVNLIAPEHLEVLTRNPESIVDRITNAGGIFVGEYSPVVLGDYSSGLNHVLPTGGYARTFSPLSVRDFLKAVNILKCSKEGFSKLKNATVKLARMEGLYAHAKAVEARG